MSITRATLVGVTTLFLSACANDSATRIVSPDADVPGVTATWTLHTVSPVATNAPQDVWMGENLRAAVQVRVTDHRGVAVPGAAVRFAVRLAVADSVRTSVLVMSDEYGIASPATLTIPVRDTTNVRVVVTAELVERPASLVSFALRAWRDVSRFGGTAPFSAATLPIDRASLSAILPLGTLGNDDGLPSADAMVIPSRQYVTPVRAIADGLVTELDRARGTVTVRVRDQVRVRMAGVTIDSTIWVGRTLRQGDRIGVVDQDAHTLPEAGVAVRVLDGAVLRSNFVRPERYGARRSAAFFLRYLADSVRSEAFALVRRAAPDLDGRFDYDRPGRLVGTWFREPDVASAFASALGEQTAPLAHAGFLMSTQMAAELDPTESLAPFALTFAYDAERPGQVRVAIGSALGGTLGIRGIRAVAWENADPAEIGVSQGAVRYQLFAANDEVRIGRAPQVLLVQLIDAETVRAEVVPGDAINAEFSHRSILLVR